MAKTKTSQAKPWRRVRARNPAALRGEDSPHAKLCNDDIEEIRSATRQRENLRRYIDENLSNKALARKMGVHVRTIERVTQFICWAHIPAAA